MDVETAVPSAPLKPQKPPKSHKARNVCLSLCALLILVILIIVILALTVFKAKRPVTTINSVSLRDLDVSLNILKLNVDLNISLAVAATIYNPNKVGFKFGNSSAILNYRGRPVGDAPVPASKISSGEKMPMNITLNVMADRLLSDSQIYRDVIAGTVPMNTFTRISGKVEILGFIKIHVVSSTSCDVNVFISNRTVGDQDCKYKTKF